MTIPRRAFAPTLVRYILRFSSLGVFLLLSSVACRDLVGNAVLPAGTQGPSTYNTPAGALGLYRGTKTDLRQALPDIIVRGGTLSDELAAAGLGTSPFSIGATGDPIDERLLPEAANVLGSTYERLQRLRGETQQAIGLLRTYAPDSLALRGEMYALEGYAEVVLAELYCSGVPLSTLDFQRDFTYRPSSTSAEVSQHAIALLDSALAISSDSATVMALASVVKGRALLDLGQYAQAAQAVATVPDTFRYQVTSVWGEVGGAYPFVITDVQGQASGFTVANREGGNGLPFSSSNDPRAPVSSASPAANAFGLSLFNPVVYPASLLPTPVVVASGVEARLIEAEAALNANNPNWLTILNALRTTCTTTVGCPTPAPAGTGGVAGLPPLSDPGSDTARIRLVFDERAYWLFLTGHRQGDLRRLVRNYGRPQDKVYPTGPYFGGQGTYGSDVTLPISASERPNPLFHGCLDREA